ncbi:MAG: hypothetical protein ABIJ16_07640 [Bacteroidota bacterium]
MNCITSSHTAYCGVIYTIGIIPCYALGIGLTISVYSDKDYVTLVASKVFVSLICCRSDSGTGSSP